MAATTKRHPSRTRHRTAVDATAASSRWTSTSSSTAAPTARSRRSSSRAARFTRRGRTSARTCAFAAARSPPTRRRTARSAASARRRASSRSSGTWTASRAAVGLSPEEFRRRNFIRAGETSAVGQVDRASRRHGGAARPRAGSWRTTTRSARASPRRIRSRSGQEGHRLRDLHARRRLHGLGRGSPRVGRRRRGDGRRHASACSPRAPRSARARTRSSRRSRPMRSASTTRTSSRAARHARVPNSGPTVASRTCMVVGKLVETAALGARCRRSMSGLPATAQYRPGRVPRARAGAMSTSRSAARDEPVSAAAGPALGRRDVSGRRLRRLRVGGLCRRGQGRHRTCETRVDDFVAVQEIGQVIHPVLAAGQIEGGVAQAIGFALTRTSCGATAAWPTRR